MHIGFQRQARHVNDRTGHILGIAEATRTNQWTVLLLPQDFADLIGWPERVALVALVYDSLPPEKRDPKLMAKLDAVAGRILRK